MVNLKKSKVFLLLFIINFNISAQQLNNLQKDSIKTVIDSILIRDQKHRKQLSYGELDEMKLDSIEKLPFNEKIKYTQKVIKNEIGFSQQVRDSLELLQNNLDDLNREIFLTIIKKYGYPSFKKIGMNGSNIIVLHFVNPEEFSTLLPVFKIEVESGNMPPREFGSWYDRCQLVMGKKQLYGEYDKKNPCVDNLKISNKERKKNRACKD